MLPGTANAWTDAITDGKAWDEQLDAPRFRRAFVTLSKIVKRWPAPAEFLEALPPREQLALTKQPIKADPERAAKHIAEIERTLRRIPGAGERIDHGKATTPERAQ
ncbi:hypothetical protein [Pseudoxanthomonas winnipegensis]|uniref:hypothetical protein n=1 Tax=Pseudoxanthomonas winnipegensis TaxID=2480810 RepID=UPI00197E67AD|nr:hypothetical protein [Pseudoxanthomonas winnipegensis]